MRDFFKGQYDYIYFFYGLAFLFLAVICFSLCRDKSRRLPWSLFGLFASAAGINVWLELLIVVYGRTRIIALIQPVISVIPNLFLFEFARSGLRARALKSFKPWLYLPLIILALSGARLGFGGFKAFLNYFMVIPAGIIAAWVIYANSGLEATGRKPLIWLSIMLASFTVIAGLFVPRLDFFPAKTINLDSFYQFFGFPAELILGIIALSQAVALWFYSQRLLRFKPSKWAIMLSLVVLIGIGWAFTNYLDYYGGMQIIKNIKIKESSPLSQLTRELTKLERAALSLGKISHLIAALSMPNDRELEKVNLLLSQYRQRFGALDCFLADSEGRVISSAQGTSLDTRPYFKEAMSGQTVYYFTPGSNYNERVYYIASPVRDTPGKILGAVIIKKNISVKPILQYRLLSIVIILFICVLAIIFFIAWTRRENWLKLIEEANSQLKAVDKMKSDFVSIVSHELRTPLTSIRNAAAILLKQGETMPVTENERELLGIILSNTDRQTRMVNDLLDISKIEAGVMDIQMEPADITALVKEVVNSLQSEAWEKKIRLEFLPAKEPLSIRIDPEETRRVLSNLVVNAIKFTSENGKVTVALKEEGDDVQISVCDTGIGIAPEDQKKLFNKFYRACDARARQIGGSGLGLAICKGLIEAQGGRIWVESELNKGSAFYFTLPRIEKGAEDEKQAAYNR